MPEVPIIGRLHGATVLIARTAMTLGICPVLSAWVLVLSLIPKTYVGHPFWFEGDRGARRSQQIQFLKNLGLLGGLLAVILQERGRKGRVCAGRDAARWSYRGRVGRGGRVALPERSC